MDLHDDIVLDGVWIGNLRDGKSTDAGIAVSNGNGLHHTVFLCEFVIPSGGGIFRIDRRVATESADLLSRVALLDEVVQIPMVGSGASLNVAVVGSFSTASPDCREAGRGTPALRHRRLSSRVAVRDVFWQPRALWTRWRRGSQVTVDTQSA
jgi:hypothetical protein